MTKLPLAFLFLLAVLPLLNAQLRGLQQQTQIASCLAAFKNSQSSITSFFSVLESEDQNEIVKALRNMAPEVQKLAVQCNLRPIPAIRSISSPGNCVQDIQLIKGLLLRLKGIDLSNPSIGSYVVLVSAYGAFIEKIPKLLNDCSPAH